MHLIPFTSLWHHDWYFKAMNIIAKLSFWIMKPSKKSIIAKETQPLEQSIMDALEQFKREGYVKKLKTSITSGSMPSDHQELLDFLFDQTDYIWQCHGTCLINWTISIFDGAHMCNKTPHQFPEICWQSLTHTMIFSFMLSLCVQYVKLPSTWNCFLFSFT